MASSDVWENIIPSKTPTFDGVCGMLIPSTTMAITSAIHTVAIPSATVKKH